MTFPQETKGMQIRQFFRDLFGSRLVERLETDLLNLQNSLDRQLHDRDLVIADLRGQKSQLEGKISLLEMAVMPRSTREGAEYIRAQKPALPKPNFSFADIGQTKSKWEVFQENYYKEEAAKEAAEKSQKEAAPAAV